MGSYDPEAKYAPFCIKIIEYIRGSTVHCNTKSSHAYCQVSPAEMNPNAQITHSLRSSLQDRIEDPDIKVDFEVGRDAEGLHSRSYIDVHEKRHIGLVELNISCVLVNIEEVPFVAVNEVERETPTTASFIQVCDLLTVSFDYICKILFYSGDPWATL